MEERVAKLEEILPLVPTGEKGFNIVANLPYDNSQEVCITTEDKVRVIIG